MMTVFRQLMEALAARVLLWLALAAVAAWAAYKIYEAS